MITASALKSLRKKAMTKIKLNNDEFDAEFNKLFEDAKGELETAQVSVENAKKSMMEIRHLLEKVETTNQNKMKKRYLEDLLNEMDGTLSGILSRLKKFF